MPVANRPEPRPAAPTGPRAPRWVPWLPVLLLLIDLGAEALFSDAVAAGFLLTPIPVVVAFSYGPGTALLSTAGVIGLQVALAARVGHLDEQHHVWVYVATLLSGVMGTALSWQRIRQERSLVRARTVAETLQRAVLRPVPERAGDLRVAALYRAAHADAGVGGDLYALCDTRFGVRVLLGDVRGKGLEAVRTVAEVLGAFRAAAHDTAGLAELAEQLDRTVLREAIDRGDEELFVTAVLLQYAGGSGRVDVINRGHLAPLLLSGTTVVTVPCPDDLPLGLGHLAASAGPAATTEVLLPPGHTLLVHTDGVSEARDASGAFYPLTGRLGSLGTSSPDLVVAFLDRDVVAYAGRLADDLAVLALSPSPSGP
ncbi:serine/threonine-protein phosphatase [Kitasatospora sp. NBC_00240]|uniref:PP2C family protein-serine/threonine phosphatase n=1 Tax=Kitasatospora sp. NBC_00240 TaxID=2903567 RepID=UPI002256D777|nr:PP2C family protein-serine/threonine phosphatase [Kitasatospora sp. NBC_00240]MCX5213298.1 serine/threonine-protein phosphatase [Kitasatospora sp. NBC_00240]